MIAVDRILCPVDPSAFSQQALEYAVAIADYYDARVTALHIHEERRAVTATVPLLDGERGHATSPAPIDRVTVAAAEQLVARVAAHGGVDVIMHEASSTAAGILAAADALDASLIVMGSHGWPGFQRRFLGPVTVQVLRQSRRPVLVLPPPIDGPPAMPFARVLCPIDFSTNSLHALEYALGLALEADARLTLLHAIELPPESHVGTLALDERAAGARARAGADRRARLQALIPAGARNCGTIETAVTAAVDRRAHREILETAAREHCDLIVMGIQGGGAENVTLFGSTSLGVLHGATCPVLVIRDSRPHPRPSAGPDGNQDSTTWRAAAN